MSDNPLFPEPVPELSVLSGAIQGYRTSLTASFSRAKLAVEEKDAKKLELAGVLTSLSRYVEFVANGDRMILMSSNFELNKPRQTRPDVQPVENLQLADGTNPGELEVSFIDQQRAASYLVQYTQDPSLPEEQWKTSSSSRRKLVLSGLESGKRYYVRIVSLGKGSQRAYSDIVNRVVQ